MKVLLAKTMQRGMSEKVVALCRDARIPYTFVDSRVIEGMTGEAHHQGIVAQTTPSVVLPLEEALSGLPKPPVPSLAVLMDHVQDPHNLGAVIRSAEAAGAAFVALPIRRSALPTGTVAKTSAGASLRMTIVTTGNVAAAVRTFQEAGFWTVGLDAAAEKSIYDAPLPERTLLVVGGEGKGLSRTTEAACDETMRIPIRGHTGSLNASVALSLAMFEWSRCFYE